MSNTIEQRAEAYIRKEEAVYEHIANEASFDHERVDLSLDDIVKHLVHFYIAGATEERALIEKETTSLEERVKELEALKSLILDIDFMTTTEFCKAYGYDVPQWTGSKEVAVMDFLAIDARKWNIIKEAAKGRINPLNPKQQ